MFLKFVTERALQVAAMESATEPAFFSMLLTIDGSDAICDKT